MFCLFYTEAIKAPELPLGHPKPPAGATASKCPFLAAEMGQKNSGVVREASMELQEDVSEIRTLQQGPEQITDCVNQCSDWLRQLNTVNRNSSVE